MKYSVCSLIYSIFLHQLILVSLSLGVISLLNVTVRSEASNDTGINGSGLATISVNGKNYAPQTKGYNVVVFDALSGSFVLNNRLYKDRSPMDMQFLKTTIKASETPEYQPMVWPLPYEWAKPYHPASGSHR